MLSLSSHLLRFEPPICGPRNNNAKRKFSLAATGNSMEWGKLIPSKNKANHLLCME